MKALSATEAATWGETYGRQCVKTHNCYPDEITCRGTLERTCAIFSRSFDETAFTAFFAAAKRAADDARAELVGILASKARARGLVTSPGGGVGYLVGSCECPREFYAYEKEVQDCEELGQDAVELTAAFFLDHCTKAHEA